MLRITKLTDYATVILSYMARNDSSMHAATEISNATDITLPTVSKLLKTLAKENLVCSTRGSKGGYYLSRDPDKISVASVISAVEGPIALTECSLPVDDCQCQQVGSCEIRGNWGAINKVVASALESVTLADMILPASDIPVEIRIPMETNLTSQFHKSWRE